MQAMSADMAVRNKIFVSYSHKDKKLFDEFKTMMAPAIQNGVADIWDDTRIPPGAKWKEEIEAALAVANVVVLLVSPNFLASRFIVNEELPPLLKAAQDQGVSIFWFYLSSCLYERTEIANYQAAHNTSTPLDRLAKPGRQAALSEACHKLIRLAETKKISQPAGLGTPTQTQGGNQEEQILDCYLLTKYAVDYAVQAARGGGPTTMLHRRLDLASKWLDEVKGLASSGRVALAGDLSDALAEVQKVIPWLIQEASWGLPEAGEDKGREDNQRFTSARDQAHYVRKNLIELLTALPDYQALEQSDRKWSVLGFRDREDLESYLFPTLERLSRSTDPMQWDLFEWLSENPAFTPRELANEGYRTDLVMDTLNALLTKKWAEWTDLSLLGSDAKGRITPVGQRLLKRMVAQKSAAGQ